MISSYGDPVNHQGIILHSILSCFTNAISIALNASQRHLMFYTCNYNIRVTHRNGAIKHIFARIRSTEGSSADCSLFILSLHALALHLAVKNITSNLSVWRFEHVIAIHLSVVFPSRMPTGPALCAAMLISEENFILIFDAKSSTQTQEVRPVETIKTLMQTTLSSYHMESFTNGSGCHF